MPGIARREVPAGQTALSGENDLKDIVIFTASLDFNVRWNAVALSERFPNTRFTILFHRPRKQVRRLVRNQFTNLRRHGWRWIPYQAGELIRLVGRTRQRVSRGSQERPGKMFDMEALEKHPRIEIRAFADINGKEACDFLNRLRPDLGIALAAPILKRELFSIPRLGTINLHKGRLPDYRGMPPAFWELKNGEKEVGCTVHQVDAGLDSGAILLARTIPVDEFSTLAGMQARLNHMGVNMVCEAVALIESGHAVFTKQPAGGKTNTRPSLAAERALARELASKAPAESALRSFGKRLVFSSYSFFFKPVVNRIYGLLGRQRVIILLYHRVSDRFRDNVTIGIEQFDRQMAYLAANCTVVSLAEIVRGDVPRHSPKPIIAISFDDGYLDNFENAAPSLLKHQLPCTFFISTNKVARNEPFDHDLKALGFGLDNMNWQHIEQMRAWGFHFGSHTLNHVNLAAVNHEVALQELSESLNHIRSRLGQDDVLIAYPYGGKRHITPERLDMIKSLGYAACFSAYGGYNELPVDLFNIKRIGINWAFDMAAFRSRLSGWDRTA